VRRAWIPLVLVVCAAWGWTAHARAQDRHALEKVAGELAGRPVHVDCQGFFAQLLDIGSNLGEVQFDAEGHPADRTHLVRGVCRSLHRFRTSKSHPQIACLLAIDWSRWSFRRDADGDCASRARGKAEAINTLTHEAMHMHGWQDEATAQCYAIQEDAWTVRQLGGSAEEGRAIARFLYALQPGMPAEYQASSCGPGGALDLRPQTAGFPE
jgi:hypothetical protein